MNRPLILISNDDGYDAKGIVELVRMVRSFGDIIVCAPEECQSGKSRAFSMGPLTLRDVRERDGERWTACSGTPVDCIKMACNVLCPRTPDLILGGINHGDNASVNAHYSGTVGIAFEGAMKGVPSIAFSLCDYDADADFRPMEGYVRKICDGVLSHGLPPMTFLNVNVPKVSIASELRGMLQCRMARGEWKKEVILPAEGSREYHLKGYFENHEPEDASTDAWAVSNGYVAVTPSTVDVTSYCDLDWL